MSQTACSGNSAQTPEPRKFQDSKADTTACSAALAPLCCCGPPLYTARVAHAYRGPSGHLDEDRSGSGVPRLNLERHGMAVPSTGTVRAGVGQGARVPSVRTLEHAHEKTTMTETTLTSEGIGHELPNAPWRRHLLRSGRLHCITRASPSWLRPSSFSCGGNTRQHADIVLFGETPDIPHPCKDASKVVGSLSLSLSL